MNEEFNKKNKQELGVANLLVSETSRNGFVLFLAILIVAILSGVLGAFKNGEFQRSYDFVEINKPLLEVDYTSQEFENYKNDSREYIFDKTVLMYDEVLGENYEETVVWYKGYYKNYFYASSWFYLETLMNTLSVMIFYIALIQFLISKKKSNDKVFITVTGEINKIIVQDNAIPASSFEPFLDDWNNERKVKQFISNIKYKISKLERRTKFKVRKQFFKKNEEGKMVFYPNPEVLEKEFKWYQFLKKEKRFRDKCIKYIDKKQTWESFLTKDFIEENVVYEKVKYFRHIYPSFIYNGKNGIHKTTDEYSAIDSDSKRMRKDLFKKIILGFSVTAAFATILSFTLFRANDSWMIIVFNVVLKMLPLVLQWILGVDHSNVYMSEQLIPTQRYRLSIMSLYLANKERYSNVEKMHYNLNRGSV